MANMTIIIIIVITIITNYIIMTTGSLKFSRR
jgi:hypothetical protein